jgi:hypothetical protein
LCVFSRRRSINAIRLSRAKPCAPKPEAPEIQGVTRLVDFWQLMEKLGQAAPLIYAEQSPAALERWKLMLLNKLQVAGGAETRETGSQVEGALGSTRAGRAQQ